MLRLSVCFYFIAKTIYVLCWFSNFFQIISTVWSLSVQKISKFDILSGQPHSLLPIPLQFWLWKRDSKKNLIWVVIRDCLGTLEKVLKSSKSWFYIKKGVWYQVLGSKQELMPVKYLKVLLFLLRIIWIELSAIFYD